jgi:hypothetical protein
MKDGRLHLRLNSSLLKRLRKMAKEKKTTLSELVLEQLEGVVQRHEESKALITDAEQV